MAATVNLGVQDQGKPHVLKKYRRAIIPFRHYNGTAVTLTYKVDGLSSATITGKPLHSLTAEGPNRYEFILTGEVGYYWTECTINMSDSSDARATPEYSAALVLFDEIRNMR
jgi:hypothetical protein